MAILLDGKALAKKIRQNLKEDVKEMHSKRDFSKACSNYGRKRFCLPDLRKKQK